MSQKSRKVKWMRISVVGKMTAERGGGKEREEGEEGRGGVCGLIELRCVCLQYIIYYMYVCMYI